MCHWVLTVRAASTKMLPLLLSDVILTVDIFPLHSPGYQLSMLTKDPANLDISSQAFLIPYRKY